MKSDQLRQTSGTQKLKAWENCKDFLMLSLMVDLEYPMSVGGRRGVTDTWLTHCAKRRKFACLIPAEVVDIFNWLNYSGSTVFLGSTLTLNRNEYRAYLLGGKGCHGVKLTTLPLSCFSFLEILEPQTPGALRGCTELHFHHCWV